MGKLGRIVPNFVGGSAIVFTVLLGVTGVGHGQNPPNYPAIQSRSEASYLDQGWGYDTAQGW